MRYLGIDYGTKRIGIALSDPEGKLAFPHSVVGNIEEILQIVGDSGVEGIVVGMPITFRGQKSHQTQTVERFVAALRNRVQLPVEVQNEVLSSKIAERTSSREVADAAAAAIILQSYLDKKNL